MYHNMGQEPTYMQRLMEHIGKEAEMAKIHPSLTTERVVEAAKRRMTTLDNPGFCIACGHEQDGCEPDARGYQCDNCGERKVYGAEELLMMVVG